MSLFLPCFFLSVKISEHLNAHASPQATLVAWGEQQGEQPLFESLNYLLFFFFFFKHLQKQCDFSLRSQLL